MFPFPKLHVWLVLAGQLFFYHIAAQEPADSAVQRQNAIRVFIDCAYCDINYIRDEIPYVNYVRDVREAQVYILESSEQRFYIGNFEVVFRILNFFHEE